MGQDKNILDEAIQRFKQTIKDKPLKPESKNKPSKSLKSMKIDWCSSDLK